MSQTTITITVLEGRMKQQEYVLDEHTTYVIGRSRDCDIVVPTEDINADVSRYHCMLDTTPATLSIRDLGSLNGTFVNGKKLGQRLSNQLVSAADICEPAYQELKDGDEIRIGKTILRLGVVSALNAFDALSLPLTFV